MNDLASRQPPACDYVELGRLDDGRVAIRNNLSPDGPHLVYTRAGLAAFVDAVKAGEYDDFLSGGDGAYIAVIVRPARDLASADGPLPHRR